VQTSLEQKETKATKSLARDLSTDDRSFLSGLTGAGRLSVGLTAEGATAAEAIDRLADQVRTGVNSRAKLADLSIAACAARWQQDAGYLRDDLLYEPWREAMEEYRRTLDEDPDAS
jgi:hypothetical protein